ncbi:MAG TPA: carotenoid biosynthesis protein [Candidatus Brocadiales bacterium]|nr:carotenoid biosynthesis protein [Candidatus Brocadiales bacterium]
MIDFLSLLLSTLMLRPYVFALFAFYVVAGSLQLGLRKIIIFTALGYFIAFISEFASTRIGIPYGYYYYIEATRNKELWVSNVPFMDSLSYTFLAYFSYSMALLFRLPVVQRGYDVQLEDNNEIRRSGSVLALSVILFVLQDVIADPLALRGSRWFLGQIYGYPYEGLYFGVPVANFLGWTVVGLVTFSIFRVIDELPSPIPLPWGERVRVRGWYVPCKPLMGPALYFCTMIFNVTITFYIGEYILGLISLSILCILLWLVGFRLVLSKANVLVKGTNTITNEDIAFLGIPSPSAKDTLSAKTLD